jgi:glutamate dehydrogenase/leucine dehydrogenase
MLPNIAFDDIGPERIHCFYDPKSQMRAMVVIDTTRFTLAGGGVRMAQDVSLTEVVRLARAMTLKYAMLEMPCGGAKAGIILDPSDASRADVMGAFLRAIKPLVDSGAFIPAADMGTSGRDFAGLFGGGPAAGVGSEMFEGMPLEAQLTGAGVVVAAKAACEALSRPLRGVTVAIEGFGKVGAGAAKFFAREGARVVAISTVRGTLHDPRGLDVDALLALRDQHGDGALALARGERMPREALFQVDAFVLVPGARPDVIHAGNVDRIAAKLIVPAANIPYGEGALARLATRGIVALPDFVTNAGGVLGSLAGFQGESAAAAFALVDQQVSRNVKLVMDAARETGTSPFEAAMTIARRRLAQ